jgi:hypothetical protein
MSALSLILPVVLPAQCPSATWEGVVWDGIDPDEETKEAILIAARQTFTLYCQTADFKDAETGFYSSEKGQIFHEMLRYCNEIYNDLYEDVEIMTLPLDYRDLVSKNLTQGVNYNLKQVNILSIRKSDTYYIVTITYLKDLYNGLDTKLRYKSYPRTKPRQLSMEMLLRVSEVGSGRYEATIDRINSLDKKEKGLTTGKYLDFQIGGMTAMAKGETLMPLLTNASLPDHNVQALALEVLQSRSLGVSEHWYWSVGLGVRRGQVTATLDDDLVFGRTSENTLFGGAFYPVNNNQRWVMSSGGEVNIAFSSVYLPLGVRWNLNPSLSHSEWLLDLHLLAGYTWLQQEFIGGSEVSYGYGDNADYCADAATYRQGDNVWKWGSWMAGLRFSPGYYSSLSRWSKSHRHIGWFIRLDLETSLMPLFRLEGDSPWVSLQPGMASRHDNPGRGILFQEMAPTFIGGRIGIFLKSF